MNNYNPTTYTGNTYGNTDETSSVETTNPETQAVNNQPLSQSELESFFKEWLDKTITQSTNLSEQSKIIKDKHKQNDALMKENDDLRAKIAELENQLKSGPTYTTPDMSVFNSKIDAMEQQLNDFKKQEALRKMEPLIELVKSYNVPREDVNKIWTGIKSEYGVDIVANPNSKLVKTYLDETYGKPVEQSIPQGGYATRVQTTQADEIAYQQKKQAYLNEMYASIQRNK